MKKLYLMRHGQTLFNERRIIQGWCDSPLTELGIKQTRVAKQYFEDNKISFTHAYSSTSERASDTLELITDIDYQREKGLKEWNFGLFEGESEDLNPQLPYGDFFYQFGGEKELEFRKRVNDTLLEIMAREGHDSVLVVGHGAMAAQFVRVWADVSEFKRTSKKIGNCAIFEFEYHEGKFNLINIVSHDFSKIM